MNLFTINNQDHLGVFAEFRGEEREGRLKILDCHVDTIGAIRLKANPFVLFLSIISISGPCLQFGKGEKGFRFGSFAAVEKDDNTRDGDSAVAKGCRIAPIVRFAPCEMFFVHVLR